MGTRIGRLYECFAPRYICAGDITLQAGNKAVDVFIHDYVFTERAKNERDESKLSNIMRAVPTKILICWPSIGRERPSNFEGGMDISSRYYLIRSFPIRPV